jgi:hypothetical protein
VREALNTHVDASHNAVLVVNGVGGDDQISMPTLVGSFTRVLYGSAHFSSKTSSSGRRVSLTFCPDTCASVSSPVFCPVGIT